MSRRWSSLALLASVGAVIFAAPATAQTTSKWCEYRPRSLTAVTSANDSAGPGGDLVVSGEQFPTRARLQFVDSIRPLDSLERHFLNGYWTFLGRVYMDTLFSETALFRDDSSHRAYWVPVQITMLAALRTELQGGDTLTGFMLWAGKYKRVDHQYRDVFLLNEFTSPQSAEYWRSELSSCRP